MKTERLFLFCYGKDGTEMFATRNKKMLNMLILDILEQYSDEDHHLTQQEIIRHLRAQYGMECDRRSVKNNIDVLKEMGFDIVTNNKGAFLAERKFDNAELRLAESQK